MHCHRNHRNPAAKHVDGNGFDVSPGDDLDDPPSHPLATFVFRRKVGEAERTPPSAHKFELTLSADAPTSVAVRFQGPGFTSGSMGGEMIPLDPGAAKHVDGDGFDVSPGDDLGFDVRLYPRPLSLDDLDAPPAHPLATFVFHRKVGEDERTPPPDLANKQCKVVG